MSNDNIFEIAVRNRFRFPYKGMITTEDLWDLSVTDLDSIFKTLNSQVKQVQEESLLATRTKEDAILSTMIEIVKYIVSAKLIEQSARVQAAENREKKQKIMEILAHKQDADLLNKSTDELKAMLDELK